MDSMARSRREEAGLRKAGQFAGKRRACGDSRPGRRGIAGHWQAAGKKQACGDSRPGRRAEAVACFVICIKIMAASDGRSSKPFVFGVPHVCKSDSGVTGVRVCVQKPNLLTIPVRARFL